MKNIVENQDIKTDKQLAMSYEALKAERDALEVRLRNALTSEQESIQRAHAANQTIDALAVENAELKKFGDKLNEMHNDLNGEGTGIQGRAEVVCQQAAIEAAMDEFDAITTPATSAALAAIEVRGVEKFAAQQEQLAADYRKLSPGCYGETSSAENALMARDFAAKLREAK